MAIDEVLISALPGETRIALLDEGRLVEFWVARADLESRVGDIYLGRVTKVVPGIAAAFVDLGLDRSGFLAADDARPWGAAAGKIIAYVREGDAVLVQVIQDATGDKGARLTARVVLGGKYLEFAPWRKGIHFAPGTAKEAQERLVRFLRTMTGDGDGLIVPAAAVGADPEALACDADALYEAWRSIESRRAGATPPMRLYAAPDTVVRILRSLGAGAVARVVVDDVEAFASVRALLEKDQPELLARLVRHKGNDDLFMERTVDEQIDAALAPIVTLPSGGTIVIDEATALTAIDVNTAADAARGPPDAVAQRTNEEAVLAIARALRLRNVGGLIVVDFVPLRRRRDRDAILARLRQAVADDPAGVEVAGFTRLGLVEMTRRRTHPSLLGAFTMPCPGTGGTGRVKTPATAAFDALRALRRATRAAPGRAFAIRASPPVVAMFDGVAAAARAGVAAKLGRPLVLKSDATVAPGDFGIELA
jgi:ribonuclease G